MEISSTQCSMDMELDACYQRLEDITSFGL